RSESPGTKKIIQAWYSIPTTKIKVNGVTKLPYADYDKDKDPISLDQIAGSYSGSVTITISAI
ncbi:MAG: hypothetical protein NTU54_00435, partial [Candidatus Omnitrophica bacterium]|nr:hypothetical protein [Candidatus Omnitrophota bacterium]